METGLSLLILFAILGGGIRIIDRGYDDLDIDKRVALLLAPGLICLWIYLSLESAMSATILGSILLSSLLSGKIDNFPFKLSTLVIILAFLLFGFEMMIFPLIFLTFLGYFDEIANGYVDNRDINGWKAFIFNHRFGMKCGVALLYAISILDLTHLFVLYSFDLAYESATANRMKHYKSTFNKVLRGLNN
ncbi:MAG: hypothetical protein QF864_06270 [SAR202 cluster bacterium]|jgi:hypothetical protein|nr:hypothetical protein [SAR202 cluster bacterium]|tara:strand:+ start:1286 stop:1855 length:570 start_codon:yes stop_codon:yes gene_type:complete